MIFFVHYYLYVCMYVCICVYLDKNIYNKHKADAFQVSM